jgi:hypothetical protein
MKVLFNKYIILLSSALSFTYANSQSFLVLNEWKRYRHELSVGGGISNFLGDLGGLDKIGSPFIYDLEWKLTKPAWSTIIHRYYLQEYLSIRNSLFWGNVAGDDKLTKEPFRSNRNLHFKSVIVELATGLEVQIMKRTGHNRHNLRNVRGRRIGVQGNAYGIYGFAGVGVFYFNPKAQYQGRWVALQPLRTEGQGLANNPNKPYSRISVSFPMGFGLRYDFRTKWGFSIELSHHFTITDYIDDVSTSYYDQNDLNLYYGPVSAYLSNPTTNTIWTDIPDYPTDVSPTQAGMQRGDETDKDGFLFLNLTFNYKFKNQYRGPRGAVKYKKRRASF